VTSPISRLTAKSGNTKVIMTLKIILQQRISLSSLFARPLWLVVSESGISELVFFKAGLAVNKDVYISKCLPILRKFIQKHHKNEKIVFRHDLASAHYAKDMLVRLGEEVPKKENTPNVPRVRPI
jgi:hypothetical protein